ncbi:hypothetical protein [Sphingomonas sp.]|uniref:hypothetical protein n=1 Tax=Sphingomonas sp. TaxID=28214 RepID=UPI0025D46E30|nr:hypothetical protein [Sphingomonas sp.]
MTLDPVKRPTQIKFRQLPPGYQFSPAKCATDPRPIATLSPVDAAQLAATAPLESLDIQYAHVLELDAEAENYDPLVREDATVVASAGGRTTWVVLHETGPNTGVFAAAVPATRTTGTPSPCEIRLAGVSHLTVSFEGDEDSTSSVGNLLIDPEGYVFDSRTGDVVDGATVTLIDNATGQPAAVVFGDDGVSLYPSTVVSGGTVTDASGHVYQFDHGNFRFPLAQPGTYRLKITPPAGFTAPSVYTADELAGLSGPPGQYRISDASYGGTFTLASPEPVHVDVPVDDKLRLNRLITQISIEKTASVRDASPGDMVQYQLQIHYSGLTATQPVTVVDTLPKGMRYRPGSVRGAAEPTIDGDGRTMRFALGPLKGTGTRQVTYVVQVTPEAPMGEAVNHAHAEMLGLRTEDSSASVRIHALLFTDALTLIGRVTEGGCGDPSKGRKGVQGVRLVLEDGSFTITDKDGLYHFEGVRPGTHVVHLDTGALPPGYAPQACDRDTRSNRDGTSRFVEGQGGSLQRADFQLQRVTLPANAQTQSEVQPADDATAAGGSTDWAAAATPGKIDWLFPDATHNPRSPAVRAVVQHAIGQVVALTLNGKPVDPLSFDGTDEDAARGVAVSKWSGLPLVDGDNRLQARVLGPDGATVATLERIVHYANTPAQATYVAERSKLVADGLNKPLIAVRIVDKDGKPVRAGTPVAFRVDQPYTAAIADAAEQTRQLAGLDRTEATERVIGDDGIALIALQPTTQAGSAHITVLMPGMDHNQPRTFEIKPWLAAPARDWMIVGFGKGTIGYTTLARHSVATRSHDVVTDGQLAVYAKGRIKGSWLLTMAYDSDRRFDRDRGLLGRIDPDRYYTVYGDGTIQGQDAATRGKLYLRLERRDFYALFGDFETGFTDTRLARYSRTLSGGKAEFASGNGHITIFAAKVDERYGRDEIQGNGLSGPYRLSVQDIVPNSDKIRLETRNRYRSEQVLDSKQLTRHIDYDIDPVAGTIRFKEPILSRDNALNPVFIVVDYETYGPGKKLAAGGRASLKLAEGKVEVGATLLHDETVGNATVAGVDIKVRPTANTEIRAEAATGGQGGLGTGRAVSVEVEHHGPAADVLAYARRQDPGFGLGQQNQAESGTQKIGVDGRLRLGKRLNIAGSAWMQDDLVSDASRIAVDARIEYQREHGSVYVGGQFASDRGIDGKKRESQLFTVGATQRFFGDKVELSGQGQLAIGGRDESTDFPARQQIGLSWKVAKDIRLIGGYEIAKGDSYTAHAARVGFDVSPWAGARIMSTLNQQAIGENGQRTFAQYGLSQSLPVGKRWTIDATVDASGTISGHVDPGSVVNPFQPRATGGVLGQDARDGDFVAVTLGATYRADRWSWTGRAEYRTSDLNQRIGFTSSLLRTLGEGRTLASSVNAYRITDKGGAKTSFATGDLALAIRPPDSHWAVLERFQLRHEQADAGASSSNALAVPTFAIGDQSTLRAVNNIALSYRTGAEGDAHGLEVSAYYGAKFVRGRYSDEQYDGFIDVIGLEIRKDVRHNFDVGVSASMQHSWTSGTKTFAIGPSVGFSPGGNAWVSAGYNFTGYRDRDFEDTRYTRQGAYLTLRVRLDKDLLGMGRLLDGDRK